MVKVIVFLLLIVSLGLNPLPVEAEEGTDRVFTVKPEILKKGDTIGIVAPGYPVDRNLLEKGISYLKSKGYKVILGEHVFDKSGFFAAKDELRIKDINAMFANPEVKAIICARGGYGSIRLVENLDFELIRQNPKIFMGYSDITTLLTAIYQSVGLITFHGPMVTSDMSREDFSFYNENLMEKALTSTEPIGDIANPQEYQKITFINNGTARGELIGGNLTVITSTLGTDFEVDTRGKILFLEEVGEATYRIDRMLHQLKLAGKFDQVSGVIFGESVACKPKYPGDLTVKEVIQEFFDEYDFPVLYGLTIGHGVYKATLPIGVEAELDSESGFRIVENGVTGSLNTK